MSVIEPRSRSAARPPNLRGDRLSAVLCFGVIAIGIIALIGYALGNASITSISANGKPVPVVAAFALILLGAGLLALRSPASTGLLTARRAALAVIVLAAADLLSLAFSRPLDEWQLWAARGGVNVHAYPFAAFLFMALGSALFLITTRRNLTSHMIASAVLLICGVFSFGYVLSVPSFLDPSTRVLPVAVATFGMILISIAELLARPGGWVVPLLARTPAGLRSRLLLAAAIVVPFTALALRALIVDAPWYTHEVGLTVIVAVNVFFSATIVLSLGVILHKRESDRARLASIVESSDDAIVGTSSDALIESWNAGAERMYGYTAAEAIGRSVTMIAPPEQQEEAPGVLDRLRRGERVDSFETVRVAKDGRRVDVLLSVSPVLDDAGNVVGASAIAHDITDRRKAEEARVESEARYRTLVENLPQKIMLKDRHSTYVSVNEAYARDLRVDPAAVAGKTDYDFFPEDLAEKYRADDARIMDAGVAEELEEEYVEGGQRRFVHTVKTPLEDPQGTVTSILVILWDITEKKLAEERLRVSEEQYRTLFEAMDQGFCVIDMLFDPNGKAVDYRFVEINPAFERQSGLQQALGKTIRQMVPNHDSHWFEIYGEVSRTGEAIRFENAAVAMQRYFDVFAFRIGGEGSQRVGVLFGDITERKQTEQALRESEARYRQLFAANPHPMWFFDLETLAFLEVNDAAVARYGYRREEFQAMTIADIRPSEEVPRLQVHLSAVGNGDFDDAGTWKHRTKDGAIIDVEVITHILDYDGRRAKLVLALDITERLRAEEALRDSEEALAEAQQIAQIGSWTFCPESGEGWGSAEAHRIFAIDRAPVIPLQLILDRIHEDDRARVRAAVAASLHSGALDEEARYVTPRGTRMLRVSARKRKTNEPRPSMIGTIQDITEMKAAEITLRQHTESLERYTADLERFNRLAVGRELRMIEMKQQINDLCAQLGQPAPYVLPEERALAKET